MMDEQNFVAIAALVGEPARARMLWNLLDGRAYTASELAIAADISGTAASNHLAKLLEADLLKVDKQGRHRYFSFAKPEIAYVVESLASLATPVKKTIEKSTMPGIRYCRSCYDHLAGYVGVQVTQGLEAKKAIRKSGSEYIITNTGWEILSSLEIEKNNFENKRRPLTRQCLDWSERRPHLAGQVGAAMLDQMLARGWFRKVRFSRELIVTSKGGSELRKLLGIEV